MEESNDSKGRLLIAEDEVEIAAMLGAFLRGEGYAVEVITSVADAKEYQQWQQVDMLITDWNLWDGTGDEVCAAARASQPEIPIIVYSGMYEERSTAIERCRPTLYLAKPLKLDALGAMLRNLMARHKKT